MSAIEWIKPDWPAPPNIVAGCSTRTGGVSQGGFSSLNLASHVDDDIDRVISNRDCLIRTLQLPEQPQWLDQTHSVRVIDLDRVNDRNGDAATTAHKNRVAVVLTADCLPVLFCDRPGSEVAAAHAGWRGLLNGVLERTVESMKSDASEIMAWMGPAIGPGHFEVGEEVRQSFIQPEPELQSCFVQNRPGHFLCDLYAIASLRLKRLGLTHIYGGEFCTYRDQERFFSYRRERVTGRQASLIYIK